MNELEWLHEQRPEVEEDLVARARARRALLEHTRPRRRSAAPRRVAFVAVAALFAAAMAIAWPTSSPNVPIPAPEVAEAAPLVLLSERIKQQPAPKGDATLVRRSHHFPDARKDFTGHDLYLDDGRYFFGSTRQQLKETAPQEGDFGLGVQAAAAADYDKMVAATYFGHPVHEESKAQRDNRVWFGSMDALLAGAGRADVRAGVMQLLAKLPRVKVAESAETLRITSTDFAGGYQETLVVDARTGVPVKFVGGVTGQEPSVTVDYEIKRVTAANWADAAA